MHIHTVRKTLGLLALPLFCLSATDVLAKLPKPIEAKGVILAVDQETKTLVFKLSKEEKPFLLDWNEETKFIKDGQPAGPAALKERTVVMISYTRVSFRNPLLKKVTMEDRPATHQTIQPGKKTNP